MHIYRPCQKTLAKYQKDQAKTVGGVAFTRFCDGQSDRRTDRQMHSENQYVSQSSWEGGDMTRV